jgi:hypothetical protein
MCWVLCDSSPLWGFPGFPRNWDSGFANLQLKAPNVIKISTSKMPWTTSSSRPAKNIWDKEKQPR